MIGTFFLSSASAQIMVFDAARDRVMYPGREWDGAHWREKVATFPLGSGVFVYDPARQRVLGMNTGMAEWDGHAWSVLPGINPFRVVAATRVAATGQILTLRTAIFGAPQNETWTWSGGQWQRIVTATSPSFYGVNLADDPVRNRVVAKGITPQVAELWEFDGVNWTFFQTLTGSLALTVPVHDPVRQQMLLVGSNVVASWDGQTLTTLQTMPGPAIYVGGACFDPARGQVLRIDQSPDTDTMYALTPSGWQSVGEPLQQPQARPMYDEARDCLMSFDNRRSVAKVYEWDGGRWTVKAPPGAPTAVQPMCYDPVGQRTFCWDGGTGVRSWDGQAWTQHPSWSPAGPGYSYRTTAFDRARNRLVLLSTYTPSPSPAIVECWEFDGQTWTQTVAPAFPSIPEFTTMGYDIARQRIVAITDVHLSGLQVSEFDGTTWTYGTVTNVLPPSADCVYDPIRGGVLYATPGGYQLWNGQSMVSITPASLLPNHGWPIAFDTRRGSVTTHVNGTIWRENSTAAAVAEYGTACGQPGDAVSLSLYGLPRPNGTFEFDVRAAAPQQLFIVALGDAPTPVAIGGGCTLHVQGIRDIRWSVTNAAGFGHLPVAVPDTLALRGLQAFAQAAVLDPLAPLGVALTQGLRLTIGD